MKTRYWRFKAYDVNLRITEGVLESPNFVDMALRLRQKGWQLLSATTIDRGTYNAELQLARWQQMIPSETETQTEIRHPVASLIRRISRWLTRLFFTK